MILSARLLFFLYEKREDMQMVIPSTGFELIIKLFRFRRMFFSFKRDAGKD